MIGGKMEYSYRGEKQNIKLALDELFISGAKDITTQDVFNNQPRQTHCKRAIWQFVNQNPGGLTSDSGMYNFLPDYPLMSPKNMTIVDEYIRGTKIRVICDIVGMSMTAVESIVHKYKHNGLILTWAHRGRMYAVSDDEIIRYIGKYELRDISRLLCISTPTVSRRVRTMLHDGRMPSDKMIYFSKGRYQAVTE